MNYQSFLSAILDNKYYTQCKSILIVEEIKELASTIQRNSRLKILSFKQTFGQDHVLLSQIYLYCSNKESQRCGFSHLFRKVHEVKGLEKFELISSHEKHSLQCQDFRTGKKSQQKYDSLINSSKSKALIQSIVPHVKMITKQSISQTCTGSPVSKQSIINNAKMDCQKSEKEDKKFYTQGNLFCNKTDQFNLLKKQLELQSKGLLSRSTEFQSEQSANAIKKIKFHCKFDVQCPYQALLTLQESQQKSSLQKMYSLQIINPNHLQQCILDQQIINYNQNTMKIDKQIDVLTKIIQQNSHQLKPKDILKKLSQKLNEQEEFIYNGLQKKINRRAIKKYFDNCVAKVRSKVFPNLKADKIQSPTRSKASKKDEDFYWK